MTKYFDFCRKRKVCPNKKSLCLWLKIKTICMNSSLRIKHTSWFLVLVEYVLCWTTSNMIRLASQFIDLQIRLYFPNGCRNFVCAWTQIEILAIYIIIIHLRQKESLGKDSLVKVLEKSWLLTVCWKLGILYSCSTVGSFLYLKLLTEHLEVEIDQTENNLKSIWIAIESSVDDGVLSSCGCLSATHMVFGMCNAHFPEFFCYESVSMEPRER